jgi:hypothetical protein
MERKEAEEAHLALKIGKTLAEVGDNLKTQNKSGAVLALKLTAALIRLIPDPGRPTHGVTLWLRSIAFARLGTLCSSYESC